jgi:tetratricopeptide (TPR) repeat protein
MFYMGQSYRDAGEFERALACYLERADMGHWDEEIYVALLEAGVIAAQLGRGLQEVMAILERACAIVPTRAEAYCAAARICRQMGVYERAVQYALRGLEIYPPQHGLFIQGWVYQHGLQDEFRYSCAKVREIERCSGSPSSTQSLPNGGTAAFA